MSNHYQHQKEANILREHIDQYLLHNHSDVNHFLEKILPDIMEENSLNSDFIINDGLYAWYPTVLCIGELNSTTEIFCETQSCPSKYCKDSNEEDKKEDDDDTYHPSIPRPKFSPIQKQ